MQDGTDVLTVLETSKYLKISPQLLYDLVRGKKIPCFRVGGQWRFRKSSIERWMEKQERRVP